MSLKTSETLKTSEALNITKPQKTQKTRNTTARAHMRNTFKKHKKTKTSKLKNSDIHLRQGRHIR